MNPGSQQPLSDVDARTLLVVTVERGRDVLDDQAFEYTEAVVGNAGVSVMKQDPDSFVFATRARDVERMLQTPVGGDTGSDYFPVRSTPTEKVARGPLDEAETIDTREGTVVADVGDYVIRESDGNEYPIGPDKFAEYYERLDESDE